MVARPPPLYDTRGHGGLLLIGDAQFFFNKNLEPDKAPPNMENVRFIQWLVRHVRESQPGEASP